MIVFEQAGREQTEKTIEIALERCVALCAPLVVASVSGKSAKAVFSRIKEQGLAIPLVVVSCSYGMNTPGVCDFSEEIRRDLKKEGVEVVTAGHALSAAERSFSRRFQGQGPIEIMAHTLRMLSQGVKVGVECATMALDAGTIPYGQPIVSLGGSGGGLDTAIVLTPSYTHSILDTRIHEILCKPYNALKK